MNTKRRFAGALVAAALLLALGAGTAQAQTPIFPNASPYSCYWELNGTSGFAFVTFVNLAGSNYLRRGIQRTVYPTGAATEFRVTVTKPVPSGPGATVFEFTNNDNLIQCQAFRVSNYGSSLDYDQCSNGARQWCWQ
jgi:hypothetical protein